MQSSSQIVTTNKPTPGFLQAECPSCCPTNSVKALKGKYHTPRTCLPQTHLQVFQLCFWPLIAPGYLITLGGLPCLSSALWCQYPNIFITVKIQCLLALNICQFCHLFKLVKLKTYTLPVTKKLTFCDVPNILFSPDYNVKLFSNSRQVQNFVRAKIVGWNMCQLWYKKWSKRKIRLVLRDYI